MGDLAGALILMLAANGPGALRSVVSPLNWGRVPSFAVFCALMSGFCNTAASVCTQRAQIRGVDPGTATSISALYPALVMCLSVLVGFERFSPMKICGLVLAAGSGVCFAWSK